MPPTLITRDREAIRAFRNEHGDIVVKPLYGNGGAGVFRMQADDHNLDALIELFAQILREPFMVQRYLPEVRQGRQAHHPGRRRAGRRDQPRPGARARARSNMHVGGRPEAAELTARDQEICAIIGPELKQRGLIFVGIDVIGDYLTEINVTSPTGIREVEALRRHRHRRADLGRDRGEGEARAEAMTRQEQALRRGVRRPHRG